MFYLNIIALIKERNFDEDLKLEYYNFYLSLLGDANPSEINQDEVYEIFLKYSKYLKWETEEDTIRSIYIRPSFLQYFIKWVNMKIIT